MLRIRQCLQNDRTKQRKSLFDIQCYCLREDQNLKELLFRLNLRGTHTLVLPHFINRYFICFCLLLWNSNSYHACRSVLPYGNAMFYFVNEINPCTLESHLPQCLCLPVQSNSSQTRISLGMSCSAPILHVALRLPPKTAATSYV